MIGVKAKQVGNRRWSYRGGFIEQYPPIAGSRRRNWEWGVAGARGFVNNKAQAKQCIDRLLETAKAILDAEAEEAQR